MRFQTMTPEKADFTYPKRLHLRRPVDFRLVYENKCSVSDEYLTICGRHNGLDHPRLGLSVSRRVGPAVVRNRLRRLYREAFRLTRADIPAGIDFVLIPRGTRELTLDNLKISLVKLTHALAR